MARREFRTRVNQLATGDTKPMKNWRLPLKPRDREPIQAAIVVSATREASDTPTGLRWLIRDVTAQVQMEQALQENMEKYRVLFESFPLGITVADGAGRILESNPESERLLGITRDEQKQREIGSEEWRIVRPDGSPMPAEEYASVRALEDGRRVTNVEMGIVKPDGQVTWISVTAAPLQDGRVVVAYADISRRKEAEDKLERYAHELERSNEDLQNFAYVISHDLREPLRTTGSFLRLLDQRYAEQLDADGREFIAYAVDGVTRMRRMIEAILDLSRVETQGQALAPTDCEAVLERVLESLRYRIEETGAQVTCEPLPTVLADEAQLAQVFQNLLANALKFRRDGVAPRVHIAAQEADEWWRISVRDNGIGIEPAQAKRAFQIFQRMHTREEYEGLGIGLALCQRIVGRHGGRIWLEPAPEKGTVVHLILPKAE
jgi:PAS domain S-box-containing protein